MDQQITDFVLGNLSSAERARLEDARRFDPVLDRAIHDAEDQMAPLALAAAPLPPPPDLWTKIDAAIGAESAGLSGRTIAAFDDGDWRPFVAGIEIKTMWNLRTTLLRCAPGAVIPPHPHEAFEHDLVLSGDLIVGGRSFGSGDYQGSPAGLDHGALTTRGGCVILLQYGA